MPFAPEARLPESRQTKSLAKRAGGRTAHGL